MNVHALNFHDSQSGGLRLFPAGIKDIAFARVGNPPHGEMEGIRMRQTRVMILLGLFHLSAIGGCGTIANMNGRDVCIQPMPSRPPMPFGGVVGDAKAVGAAVMYAPKEVGRGGLMEATLVDRCS